MPNYRVNVVVDYDYEVEADSYEEAEKMAWAYENYAYYASVYSIDIYEDETEEGEE